MSETLKVLDRALRARRAAKKAKRAEESVARLGAATKRKAGEVGQAIAGDKPGARRAAALGLLAGPAAAGGAKKGTEGTAATMGTVGSTVGKLVGAPLGPLGIAAGASIGGGLMGAASQSDTVRKGFEGLAESKAGKAVAKGYDAAAESRAGKAAGKAYDATAEGVGKAYKGTKGAVGRAWDATKRGYKKKKQEIKQDATAGAALAAGGGLYTDVSRLAGNKRGSRKLRNFVRGYRFSRTARKGRQDLRAVRRALGKTKKS